MNSDIYLLNCRNKLMEIFTKLLMNCGDTFDVKVVGKSKLTFFREEWAEVPSVTYYKDLITAKSPKSLVWLRHIL